MNAYLINKKLVDEKYAGKDFTHVELSDSGDDIWDNKIAAAPSWFDYATSFILFLLPILLIGLISTIAECIFG